MAVCLKAIQSCFSYSVTCYTYGSVSSWSFMCACGEILSWVHACVCVCVLVCCAWLVAVCASCCFFPARGPWCPGAQTTATQTLGRTGQHSQPLCLEHTDPLNTEAQSRKLKASRRCHAWAGEEDKSLWPGWKRLSMVRLAGWLAGGYGI